MDVSQEILYLQGKLDALDAMTNLTIQNASLRNEIASSIRQNNVGQEIFFYRNISCNTFSQKNPNL